MSGFLRPRERHWVETKMKGEMIWLSFSYHPRMSILYGANRVVKLNSDDKFEWIKNRDREFNHDSCVELTEDEAKEMIFNILKVEHTHE